MTQATVHEFVRRGNFEPNLARVQNLLRARRDAMLEALEQHMPEGATWSRPEGGYFIWLDLDEATPELSRAEAAGVTFVKGSDFFADGRGAQSLRLAFSYVSPEEIGEGVARFAALLQGAAAPASAL
jgi:DNA-binding transcriptional MocR family regulator